MKHFCFINLTHERVLLRLSSMNMFTIKNFSTYFPLDKSHANHKVI